jgi:hypothetical protein
MLCSCYQPPERIPPSRTKKQSTPRSSKEISASATNDLLRVCEVDMLELASNPGRDQRNRDEIGLNSFLKIRQAHHCSRFIEQIKCCQRRTNKLLSALCVCMCVCERVCVSVYVCVYVSIRQHTSAYVSVQKNTSVCVSIRRASSRLKVRTFMSSHRTDLLFSPRPPP